MMIDEPLIVCVFILVLISFLYFGGAFNKTIIPIALFGYEMVIVNSYPTCACGIIVNCTELECTYMYVVTENNLKFN